MLFQSKICLITPPSPFLLDERVFLHIGILKIAAVLERAGYEVDHLDLAGVEDTQDAMKIYMEQNPKVIYGFTATTPQIPYAVSLAELINDYTTSRIILGGTHCSLMYSAKKREDEEGIYGRASKDIDRLLQTFDTLVVGDGEKAIFEALSPYSPSIVDADDKKSRYFLTDEEFSKLPLPSRHLVDMESYHYEIEGKKSVSLICQLGCPFKCTFCGGRNSPFLRKIRTRSADSVIEEIRHLYETYGYTGFMFYDDELNVNKEWKNLLKKLVLLQEELNEKFTFRGFVKAELFTQEQADLMYLAGFRWLLTGFESGDERILVNIQKNATIEDNTNCLHYAKKAGLKVKALMSIGHAGESLQSIENTKNWLLKVKPDDFDCTIITTYPGTPYFDDAILEDGYYTYTSPKTGDKLHQKDVDYFTNPDYYKGDPDGGYKSYVWTDYISSDDLVEARDKLEREVREKLGIKFNPAGGIVKFEHSMGQGQLPQTILKSS